MNPFYKNLALWLVVSLIVIMLFNIFNQSKTTDIDLPYSVFINHIQNGEVRDVNIQGQKITGSLFTEERFKTFIPDDRDLLPLLREHGVLIDVKPVNDSPWYISLLASWLPMLIFIGIWIFFMRQMQMGGGKAMSFGKSRAKLLDETGKKITFEDVAGIEEAKEELEEIVAFLKDPKKFTRLGGRIPKGVLLVGAPGTGKTLLARAISGEAGVPFFSISGSDFVEMFVGVGASRVRDLFMQGKKNAPCIIFIDEIDAVGRHRGAGLGGGHDEREQTLNQLLVEMDGFESNEGVILISATNRPDVLDPALLRPGRFDRQVMVPVPDVKGREGIFRVHLKKVALANDINVGVLARGTPGFSGADIENMVNESALLAARFDKDKVTMEDLENAKDKVMMGSERRSIIISDEERKNTAFHEAGHTLVAKMLPNADPIHKVTIIPRGGALGLTQQLPLDEKHTYSKVYLKANLAILMGGRVAEELEMDHMTTGAGNDIQRATELARKMVCQWGMSDILGPLVYGKDTEHPFLGMEMSKHKEYSEETAVKIDAEIKKFVNEAYETARSILSQRHDILVAMADDLLDHETLDSDMIDAVIMKFDPAWKPMHREAPDSAPVEGKKDEPEESVKEDTEAGDMSGESEGQE